MNQHAEWLSLIEISGPFLAEPVLNHAFPQGLEKLDTMKRQQFRQTYEEWREAIDNQDELKDELHREWIDWVLNRGLEWDEDDEGEDLKTREGISEHLKLELPEHNLTLRPEFVLFGNNKDKPYLAVTSYPAGIELNDVLAGDGWSASPAERMSHLCRAIGTRLGLITNGEQWMLVDAPEGGITSYATWYARLWSQEPVTLKAFFSLLNIRTVFSGFGSDARKLTTLFDDSLKHQDEVTETLGAQVQRAVEVLIQSLDRINHDSNGKLLDRVEPTELYEAGLTFMMRLVFLLCAEERGLLLLGDETYEANYALSTLRMKLRDEAGLHGEEVLSYRTNAWARLLAIFRAVYGGVEHEGMRMPALGGSLFDPDRFPFLEGRPKGSSWKVDEARPLPIDNRTVLLFLDAIQLFQGRTLSYRALDVEQIGYVYEGLLERTVIRSPDVTLKLEATKNAKKPWLLLEELTSTEMDGKAVVKNLLKERTGSSMSRIENDLAKEVTESESEKLLLACQNESALRDRIKPYYHFLRVDGWGNPQLYPKDSFMVAIGVDRRETGTHYTPKSLTESIVKETLGPVVYIGLDEGHDRKDWQLKSPAEILELKICDIAMGSGAFLVQSCRWLSERLLEAWALAEGRGKYITISGVVVDSIETEELLTADVDERLVTAKRLISERCLYGVDVNPLAVELAKLSIWLMTLSKNRPFGFLDHNLRHGDSLLGVTDLDQLHYLDMWVGKGSEKKLFAQKIDETVKEAIQLRLELRQRPILDIRDVEVMGRLDQQVREKLELSGLVADALVGETLKVSGKKVDVALLSIEVGQAFEGDTGAVASLKRRAKAGLNTDQPEAKKRRKAFHWCLEFPEVFSGESKGFDSIVGNPPFMGGRKISSSFGVSYLNYITTVRDQINGIADLVCHFFRRSYDLISDEGCMGLVATKSISEVDSRRGGLGAIIENGGTIYNAVSSMAWPGQAAVIVSLVHVTRRHFVRFKLNGIVVESIGSSLLPGNDQVPEEPSKLNENKGIGRSGSKIMGDGFKLTHDEASEILKSEVASKKLIKELLSGSDITGLPNQNPSRLVIDPGQVSEDELAKKHPIVFERLKTQVYPSRSIIKDKAKKKYWWRFAGTSKALYDSIQALDMCIVCSRVTKHVVFHISPVQSNYGPLVFDESVVVISKDDFFSYGCLQSSCHALWVARWGSRMGSTQRYTPTEVLETFPFPCIKHDERISEISEEYFNFRKEIMRVEGLGLTGVYNLFHAESCNDSSIKALRELQKGMDFAVVSAFGWQDIQLDHGFYSIEYLPSSDNRRFTISLDAQTEVLSRLSKLNKIRYELEGTKKSQTTTGNPINQYEQRILSDPALDKVAEPKSQMDIFGQEE